MDKIQRYIDYIFYVLWCKASVRQYDVKLFNGWKELKGIVVAFHYGDSEGGDFFNSKIESIYQLFSGLSSAQINQLKIWYKANNEIEQLCNNAPGVTPVSYSQLESLSKPLSKELKLFFTKLYGKNIIGLKAMKDQVGDIDEHYHDFIEVNSVGKCPFCGLSDIDGVHSQKREAYDHYLPKSLYPFNSINFYNLAPMCHKCNSSYKLAKDPLYIPKDPLNDGMHRRCSFYVYSAVQPNYSISITLNCNDIESMGPDEIELNISSPTNQEHLDTWMDVYAIEERYKAKCLSNTDGKYWYLQVLDECENYSKTSKEVLDIRKKQAIRFPFSDTNFLRIPFLDACESKGVFK